MGGLALNHLNIKTRRYSRLEYDNIVPEIVDILKDVFTDVYPTKFYNEKESFGDADILCLLDKPLTINLSDFIKERFESKGVVKNSNVYSFEYKELQVDLILTPLSNWETSKIYFSYNDLWNLIGKVAHRFGLKMGFDGLKYPYRIDDKMLGDVCVSKDHLTSLEFLGFDSKRYEEGFNSLTDIFEYVISSKYFNPSMFDLASLNRINRERDKKRKTYSEFLKYIEPLKGGDFFYFHPEKKYYLGLIDNNFPGFLKKFRELELKEERKRKIHSLFNGHLIMDRFGIFGPELGKIISDFKKSFVSLYEMEEWILSNDSETIMETIKKFI